MYYVGNALPPVTTGGFLVGIFYLRNSKKVLALCSGGRWLRAEKCIDLGNFILSG